MLLKYNPKNNPRVIIIQKIYGKYFNNDEILFFPKHRFKKFIKDIVLGTIERDDVIKEEIKKHLNSEFKISFKIFSERDKGVPSELLIVFSISSLVILDLFI